MTAPSTSVTLVHTDDANPDAARYRISNKTGHDTALATITADAGNLSTDAFDVGNALLGGELTPGMAPYVAAMVMTTGNNPKAQHIAALGIVCGITRCGSEGAMPLRMSAGTMTGTIKWSEIQGADRDVTVNVFTLVEPEGWL